MEEMFSSMMAGFMKGMSENDKKRMMACGEKMAAMCSCINRKDISEEEKKAISFVDGGLENRGASRGRAPVPGPGGEPGPGKGCPRDRGEGREDGGIAGDGAME